MEDQDQTQVVIKRQTRINGAVSALPKDAQSMEGFFRLMRGKSLEAAQDPQAYVENLLNNLVPPHHELVKRIERR